MWVEVARVIRGQIISIREKEFVEAARAMGFRNSRIITKHILPNVINPVIIISAANFASAILIEAGLSFLGIGVQPPMPSWGTMIKEHYGYILIDMGYLAILPGLAIMLTVLSFTLIGNGLRDALDTKG
jgi:peptide/nickel transport system permease protein